MIFKSLASSSRGNAYIVSDGNTSILIECGLPYKKLNKLTNFKLMEFSACLVSHCHADHSKSVMDLIKYGMAVYMSKGTAEALETELVTIVEHMEQFNIGSIDVTCFNTLHDAEGSLGYLVKSRIDGDILAFAIDTVNLRYKFPGLTILAIEANYSKDILERSERLPEKVKKRISNSHMEINTLCDYLKTLDLSKCREIHLLHLSDGMSHEQEFIRRVSEVVPPNIKVTACAKEANDSAGCKRCKRN